MLVEKTAKDNLVQLVPLKLLVAKPLTIKAMTVISVIRLHINPEIIALNERISSLTLKINNRPDLNTSFVRDRISLYGKKTKILQKRTSQFVQQWWNASYDEYLSGTEFKEKDTTPLFNI
ncbi:hypothetical protein N7447_004656 [Penicillium robsamsonii]|uniref:uncharacterized protein n=1 Tax=Penicillium robsamsonii TaxID=1792511 RepID=UPI0025489623|nr:uncharacterized protein N7447_004656 [Penicillium robsamsonii]KAJ5827893.1 hypothetical protein N7447_004656 [Penicillium robsamsonii]